jgi:hypothetical protein
MAASAVRAAFIDRSRSAAAFSAASRLDSACSRARSAFW